MDTHTREWVCSQMWAYCQGYRVSHLFPQRNNIIVGIVKIKFSYILGCTVLEVAEGWKIGTCTDLEQFVEPHRNSTLAQEI